MRTSFFALALLTMMTGCENAAEERAAPAACADAAVPSDATPPEASADATSWAPEQLSWGVEFPSDPKRADVAAISFRGATGLAPILSEVGAGDALSLMRGTTPWDAFGGDTKDATALAAWWATVLAHAPCDGCDPTREWISAALTREAVISARTADGEWLARWTLADAWPAEVFGGKRADGGFEVASFRLAGTPRSFALNPQNPWLAAQLKAAALAPTKLPDPTLPLGKSPSFATSILARSFAGVDGVVDGLSTFAKASNPLYASSGLSGENPLFEAPGGGALRANLEVRDGETVLLRTVGLKSETEIVEYRDGDDPLTHKRPGRSKYKNITLSRATVVDGGLLSWYDENLLGAAKRKTIALVALDRDGKEVARVNAVNATPAPIAAAPTLLAGRRWKAPELNARETRDGYIFESITFVADRFELAK